MAEGIGLLNQRTMLLYHGFESLFLRANKKRLLTFFVHLLSFPFFSQKEALKKGQYPLRVISLARFIPYPKFEYVKQGCLKSSWYFKVVHSTTLFVYVKQAIVPCFTYTNKRYKKRHVQKTNAQPSLRF